MSRVDESSLKMELVDVQASFALKLYLQAGGPTDFWTNQVNQYHLPTVKTLALLILTMDHNKVKLLSHEVHVAL